jgi:pimeloyl-ACP methyl ester carboxylesterase
MFVDVEGTSLAIDGASMAERRTLLLLHGGQVDHTWFRPGFSRLASLAQVVYVDRRGGGRSDVGNSTSWTLDRWADDIYDLCDVLGIESPIVLGSSLGGTVAMAYATRHPEHPGGLILASTSARQGPPEEALAAYRRLGGDTAARAAARYWESRDAEAEAEFLRVCAPLHARYEWTSDELARMRYSLEATEHWVRSEANSFDLLGDLHKVRCPTLVIGGADDPIAPPDGVRAIADALPSDLVRLKLIANAGHGVCRDNPEAFFASVEEFLTEVSNPHGP